MIKLQRLGNKGDSIPLVSIPGIDGSIGSIKPIVDGISKKREVIVVDYTEEKNTTIKDLADVICDKLKTEMQNPFHLWGQSIGTIIAAKLETRNLPVQKVVLTSTFTNLTDFPLRVSTFFMKISPGWLYRLTSRPMMEYACGPVGDGDDHPLFQASRNSNKNDIARRTKWQIEVDFSSDLEKINSPLLILMGEEDRFVPDASEEIEKLRALFKDKENCHIQTIPDAGHVFLPSKAIKTATQSINQFLK